MKMKVQNKEPQEEIHRVLTKEELEFLPAALEIIETPPSPMGHAVLWLLISLFVIAVIWSILGRIDEVAVASGKVIPSGYTRTIQAEDKGVVASIHVQNGSLVKEGDLLIELDTTLTEADVASLTKEQSYYSLTLRRLNAEAKKQSFDVTGLEWCEEEDIERQAELYTRRVEDYVNRVSVAEKNVQQAKEDLKQAQAVKERLKMQVKMAKEREERTRVVADRGGISDFTWQEYLEKYLALEQDLIVQESTILQNRQRLAQAQAEFKRIIDEYEKDISEQIVDVSHKLRLTEEELKKAKERHRLTQIRSPIDGIVQQLMVHTLGGVVMEAEKLMQVVPKDGGLQFEVWCLNRDIGFLHEGQRAEIKVETFNFQKYGTLDALVEMVATEAVEDEQRGLIYRILLLSNKDYFIIEDKKIMGIRLTQVNKCDILNTWMITQ
jgi:hemolysin D